MIRGSYHLHDCCYMLYVLTVIYTYIYIYIFNVVVWPHHRNIFLPNIIYEYYYNVVMLLPDNLFLLFCILVDIIYPC